MSGGKVLAIYLEPTPYLLALLERLEQRWPAGIDVEFAGMNLSQRWELTLAKASMQQLPAARWSLLKHLHQRMGSGQYALVHLAGWAGHPALPMALLLARLHHIAVSIESDTPLPPFSPWWKRILKQLWYPLMFRLPALFLAGGRRQAQMLAHYGVKPERIRIAGMTVDVAAIAGHRNAISAEQRKAIRLSLGIAGNDCVFLYVGRLEPHKGLQELMDAFSLLKHANREASLLLVGGGSMYDSLQRHSSEGSRIRCTGRLSGSSLLDAYAAADVFVLPSRFEPWGLVVNEAMAAGLPVIASERVGCVDDLVSNGENGLVVPAENVQRLAAAMQLLLDDEALCRRMSEKAALLISGWTLEHEADNMVAGWKHLVDN